jgi:ribosomal protein S18 acetylase RimI-like enzyme
LTQICYRGGAGEALVKAVIEASSGTKSIEVLRGNKVVLEFYKTCGFVEVGLAEGLMPGNEKYKVTVHKLCNTKNT